MIHGFYRIAAGVPKLHLADPAANAAEIVSLYERAAAGGAAVLVLPELAVTGATCADLFEQQALLDAAMKALETIAAATAGRETILIAGMPVPVRSRLYNCALVLQDGRVLGAAGKRVIPDCRTAFGQRQFRSVAEQDDTVVTLLGEPVPLGDDLLFDAGGKFQFGVEIGTDRNMVVPPAADLALAGAKIIFNPSAEPETAGAARRRQAQIESLSARYSCVYAAAGAGIREAATDAVFAGHALICENGSCLAQNQRFENDGALIWAEIAPAWMEQQRRSWSSFNAEVPTVEPQRIACRALPEITELKYRQFETMPFVPKDEAARIERCQEILTFQAAGLARRVEHTHSKRLVVGLSGGLDSTLALLVCSECCRRLQLPPDFICAITMPGMGTSGRTYNNACELAREIGAELREISIKDAVLQHFKDIGHEPSRLDVVYENSQARERTQILMDIANELGGLVVGTGDLSEIALGWSTYNGDHMSMYCVNCDVPKTLIRWMVECYARQAGGKLGALLHDINETPVSPELLPGGSQETEGILGSYTLHDFFLYYFIRYAQDPEQLLAIACRAFAGVFPETEISRVLGVFLRRFFTQQFKRNCAPDGPKVGSVALSAHGDWLMPSDAGWTPWKLS